MGHRFFIPLVCLGVLYTTNLFLGSAQTVPDSTNYLYQPVVKTRITIQLMNDSTVVGEVFRIWDSCLMILLLDVKEDSIYRMVNVKELHTVKVKRDAFLERMCAGIFVGGLIGYGAGSAAYTYDHSESPEQR